MVRTAAIVIIGNEILAGQTEDCNSLFFLKELRGLGVLVGHIEIIPDDVAQIGETLKRLSEKYDYIFTSGGIGPTHDDVTIEGVAKAFGVNVVRSPELEKFIVGRYQNNANRAALKMAEMPDGAELVSENGLTFPLIVFRNIFIFPGIPQYLKTKFEAIKERFREEPFYSRVIHLGVKETEIAGILEKAEKDYNVRIGSYPIVGGENHHVKVTIESKEKSPVDGAFEFIRAGIDKSKILEIE